MTNHILWLLGQIQFVGKKAVNKKVFNGNFCIGALYIELDIRDLESANQPITNQSQITMAKEKKASSPKTKKDKGIANQLSV